VKILLKTEITGVEIKKAIATTNIVQALGRRRWIALPSSTFTADEDTLMHTPELLTRPL
jgi:hypothetical protein